jgi:hypothetical protein
VQHVLQCNLDFYNITSVWVFLLPIFQMKKDNHCTPYKTIWLSIIIFMWWYTWHLIMYQLNDFNMNLSHPFHLGIFQTVYTLSRWRLFMGLCLRFEITVLLEMIRTNYSVPCQNQNRENTLMTGFIKAYNPKCLMLSNYLFS